MTRSASIPDDDQWRYDRAVTADYTDRPPAPELTVTDNPVVATLLDHTGRPIRQYRERPAFGFRGKGRR